MFGTNKRLEDLEHKIKNIENSMYQTAFKAIINNELKYDNTIFSNDNIKLRKRLSGSSNMYLGISYNDEYVCTINNYNLSEYDAKKLYGIAIKTKELNTIEKLEKENTKLKQKLIKTKGK